MQTFLITFVGWTGKKLIDRKAFGLSRTKWRKIIQGSSNILMAFAYLGLAFAGYNFWLAVPLIVLIHFLWMFGVAGESMIPYDLSYTYPATIVGVAQSIAVLSGLTLPSVCGLILTEDSADPSGWNLLFLLIAGALASGGIVLVLVLKSKPFLPGEKECKNKDENKIKHSQPPINIK